MNISIRLMTAADLSAVERIQAEAYAGYFLESADVIAQRFLSSPTTAWVAEIESAEMKGQACAYLIGYWSRKGKVNPLNAPFVNAENADCLYLHDLAIATAAQGHGISKKLFQAAEKLIISSRIKTMALLSVQNSKTFWQGFGFSEFTELDSLQQENLATYLNDKETAFYMVKNISL